MVFPRLQQWGKLCEQAECYPSAPTGGLVIQPCCAANCPWTFILWLTVRFKLQICEAPSAELPADFQPDSYIVWMYYFPITWTRNCNGWWSLFNVPRLLQNTWNAYHEHSESQWQRLHLYGICLLLPWPIIRHIDVFMTNKRYVCTTVNEAVVKQTAELMLSSGLADAGYKYLVIDGRFPQLHLVISSPRLQAWHSEHALHSPGAPQSTINAD